MAYLSVTCRRIGRRRLCVRCPFYTTSSRFWKKFRRHPGTLDLLDPRCGSNTNAYGQIGLYRQSGIFVGGAVDGINYASISFDGTNGVYEAVGKFDLGDFNVGDDAQLIAIAVSDQGALSISDGVVAIDSAAVPEPSGMLLGLLALGSSACARRRARPVRG